MRARVDGYERIVGSSPAPAQAPLVYHHVYEYHILLSMVMSTAK